MLTLAPCASAEACRRLAEVPSTSYSSCGPIGRRDGNRRRGLLPPLVRRGGSCGQRGRRSVLTHAIGGLPDDLSERLKRWAQRQKEQLQQAANGSWTSSGGGGPSSGISSSSSATGGNGAGSSSGSSSEPDPGKPRSVWSDWSGRDEDWDEWRSQVVVDLEDVEEVAELREAVIERRRQRRGKRTKVRDEYLRPIVDPQGIYNRLTYDEKEAEERVFVEAITNQYESREALKYAGALLALPLLVGFCISRLVAQPLWSYAQTMNPDAFALRDEQKVEGAHEIHMEEIRIRMESAIGQAPPINEEALLAHLEEEAVMIEARERQHNKQALLNVVSDSISAGVLFIMLTVEEVRRKILFRTVGRIFTGLSDTAKAFLIIVITDILLGYHSEEGWTAGLKLIGGHYGVDAEQEFLFLFVAIVPVVLDSLFKVWIFIGLNREDPAAAVTLRQMDRH